MITLTGVSRRRKVRSLHHRRRSPTPLQQVLNFYSRKMGEFCSHNGGCVSKGIQYYILWLWQHGEIIACGGKEHRLLIADIWGSSYFPLTRLWAPTFQWKASVPSMQPMQGDFHRGLGSHVSCPGFVFNWFPLSFRSYQISLSLSPGPGTSCFTPRFCF